MECVLQYVNRGITDGGTQKSPQSSLHETFCEKHPGGWWSMSMWRNAFKTWWSELHKSINLHITRTATVTLWELVSWTEFYGLQCSSFSVDRTLQLSINLQSAAACLSSQRRVSSWGWGGLWGWAWSCELVSQGRARCLVRAGHTGDGALRALAQSASSPHSSLCRAQQSLINI